MTAGNSSRQPWPVPADRSEAAGPDVLASATFVLARACGPVAVAVAPQRGTGAVTS